MGLTMFRAEKGSSGTSDNGDSKPETSLIMRTNIDLLENRVGRRPALIGRRLYKLHQLIGLASLPLLMWLGDPCIAQSEPETICHTVNVEPARLNWIAPIQIPQFDPRLGNLESVTIQVEASTTTDFKAENLRNSGEEGAFAPVEVSISTTVSLQSGDAVLAAVNPKVYRVEYLAARYDGIRDFAGASGVTRLGITASDAAITILTAANGDDLGAFVGQGNVAMTLAASGIAKVKGSGNLMVSIATVAAGTVNVCYAYRQSPPGSGFYVYVEGQTVCEGELGVLTAQVITEGNGSEDGNYQYFWYDSQNNLVTDENGNPVNSQSIQVEEPGVYRVQVLDGNGVSAEATGELVVLPSPEPGLTIPTPLPTAGQQGTLAPINIDPNASYEWAIIESTGPGWAIVDCQNSAIVTYRAGSSGTAVFSLTVTYPNGCPKKASIRFGLNPGEGCTIGFWRNKNGLRLITEDDFSDLNRLRLRNANGSDRDFDLSSYSLDYNKGVFRNWLTYASSVNMAYMLSAQLAAFTLNVGHGFYTPETLIPVTIGGVTHLSAIDLIEEVNALLSDASDVNGDGKEDGGYVPKGHPNRALFEAYSKALDAANNNCRR